MKKILSLFQLLLIVGITQLNAATVDTVVTFSHAMNKNIKAVVIKPKSYKSAKQLPVIYLLHGHSGKYADWVNKVPHIKKLSDDKNVIIVCPDGNYSSWYFDSPVNKDWKYETYMTKELVSFIDGKYKTISNKSGRAITGLSMGGHGALFLAMRNQDIYGAAGSMSGGVDFRPFPTKWGISEKLGSFESNPENWETYTVTNMIGLMKNSSLKLMIDCGTEDFFFKVNKEFHEKLINHKINHDFVVKPGAHNWDYWANAIDYQVLFMTNFFKK